MSAERRTNSRRIAIFTICSNNYMPFAHVLLASVRRHHPEATLFLCLADRKVNSPAFYGHGWTVIEASDLAIPDFPSFAFRYDIMEFNTALKPFMFMHLLDDCGFDDVIYFDPDIELFAPLVPVLTLLREGSSFVFTPHLCAPSENPQEPNDLSIMRAGSYNLGFLAVSNTEETIDLIGWWARRLRYQCINDQPAGIFVDQKFMDLIPSFAAKAAICRDTALNVAYWNLEQRRLDRTESGWLVDGAPLIFFHFSGFDPHRLDRLSKHDPRFVANIPQPLQTLMNEYAERLFAEGHGRFPGAGYAYSKFASGTLIHPVIRAMFRDWHAYWGSDPFEDYEAFLQLPWPEASCEVPAYTVTNFMRFLQGVVPSLGRFDPRLPEDAARLVLWFVNDAIATLGLDAALVEPAAARLGRLRTSSARVPAKPVDHEMEVSISAPLHHGGQAAQSGQLAFQTLLAAGFSVEMWDTATLHGDTSAQTPVQITYLAAADLEQTARSWPSRDSDETFRILAPIWDWLPFPSASISKSVLRGADEIWAPSRFTQLALAGQTDCPVIHMPLPIVVHPDPALPVCRTGVPAGRFSFFSHIGALPDRGEADAHATIHAFRMAFPRPGHAFLVLASGDSPLSATACGALLSEIDGDPDILLLTARPAEGALQSLIASCSAFLSLHKGLGTARSIGQAMLLGRPVIATDYSASRDLLTASTGFPLSYRLVSNGGRSWAEADIAQTAWVMRQLAAQPEQAAPLVAAARAKVESHHSIAAVATLQRARLTMLGMRVT
jgi:hypothetical protein